MTKIAIIQRPPVLLDRAATLSRALQWVAEATAAGASLIVFPESFIPGYPSWIWRLAAGRDGAVMGQLRARLLANAVDVGGGDLAELCEAARAHQVTIVCGIHDLLGELHAAGALRAPRPGRGDLRRAHLRQWRRLDRHDAPYCARRSLLGRRQRRGAARVRTSSSCRCVAPRRRPCPSSTGERGSKTTDSTAFPGDDS